MPSPRTGTGSESSRNAPSAAAFRASPAPNSTAPAARAAGLPARGYSGPLGWTGLQGGAMHGSPPCRRSMAALRRLRCHCPVLLVLLAGNQQGNQLPSPDVE